MNHNSYSAVITTIRNENLQNAIDHSGATLLHLAANNGEISIVDLLINAGANVNVPDKNGNTPLMVVLKKKYINEFTLQLVIRCLLNAGAHITNLSDDSPLKIVLHGKFERYIVQMFVDIVNEEFKAIEGVVQVLSSVDCPLYHAMLWKNKHVTISRLVAGCDINERNPTNNESALHISVKLSDLENVKILLENGAEVNSVDALDRTPLYYINVLENNEDRMKILKFLISAGASIHVMEVKKILMLGCVKMMRLLFNHGLSVFERNEYDQTPLHLLSVNRNEKCLRILEARNFDANSQDEMGHTALHFSASAGLLENSRFLLDHGADVNIANSRGITPLGNCLLWPSWYTAGPDSLKRRVNILELFVQNGANVEYEDKCSRTIFDVMKSVGNATLSKPILLHLAIQEILGKSIKPLIRSQIRSIRFCDNQYKLYKQDVELMKKVTVYESVTLFRIISANSDIIIRYARNQELVAQFAQTVDSIRDKYCKEYLTSRFQNAIRIAELRQIATTCLERTMKIGHGSYAFIVDRILDNLNVGDLKNFIVAFLQSTEQ